MGKLRIMDQTGDTRIEWNSNHKEEVEIAKAQFEKSVKSGMVAYSIDKDKNQKEIKEFDPLAEEILLVPKHVPGPDPASDLQCGAVYEP